MWSSSATASPSPTATRASCTSPPRTTHSSRIRYATGDDFTPLGSACGRGSELPLVRIEGRATHMIQLVDGRVVTPGAVDALVGDAPGIDVYKLEQDRTGACTFRYIPNADARTDDTAALAHRLTEALAPNPLRVEAVDHIASERSGRSTGERAVRRTSPRRAATARNGRSVRLRRSSAPG
ncbi:hypothetical protein [Streptomyces sp. NPDC051636]|uniref:hypothetical protein n=1 Tax=Streptomyces sp. NPDC051636 TaxID=3365663 RepID=UPI00379EE308